MPRQRRRKTGAKKRRTQNKMKPSLTQDVGIVIDSAPPKTSLPAHFFDVDIWPTDLKMHGQRNQTLYFGSMDVPYRTTNTLGEGSFGYVVLIQPVHPEDREEFPVYALKRFFKVNGETSVEMSFIRNPKTKGVMVPAKSFGKDAVLMQLGIEIRKADIARFNREQVSNDVTKAVLDLEKTLISRGLIYTDVKAANVLAVPVPGDPNASRIMFADYGGLCRINEKHCVYTYMLPERVNAHYKFGWTNKDKAELAARYWAGVVGMQVKGIRNYNNVIVPPRRGLTGMPLQKWYSRVQTFADKVGGRAGQYLDPDPEDRWSIMNTI